MVGLREDRMGDNVPVARPAGPAPVPARRARPPLRARQEPVLGLDLTARGAGHPTACPTAG